MIRLSRRAMLATTLAASAGMMANRSLGAAQGARWAMRFSGSSIQYSRLPIEQACRRIAALGFEAIDIWSPHAKCPHLDDCMNRLGAEGVKAMLTKHKLKLYAFSVYAGGYRKYAQFLGDCGGGVAVRGSSGPVKPEDLTSSMKKFLEGLKPDLELCEKYNSYLAIENHGNALLESADSFKAFVDLNRHPRCGLALAPYHLQSLKASVEETIMVAGRQLLFFYAWQNAPETKQLPGIGPTDCGPWLKALAKIEFKHYVSPFMHHEPEPDLMSEALKKSKEYLEGVYAKEIGA